MSRFLIWLSGANRRLLDEAPTDRAKYVGIGTAVLTTAAMAGASATLAFTSGVHLALPVSIVLAVCWGLAILFLDRWLVASVQRQHHWYQNLLVALPRLLLAVLIGLVVSTPLVLRVFQSEISAEIDDIHRVRQDAFTAELATGDLSTQIDKVSKDIAARTRTVGGATAPPDVRREPDVVAAQARVDAAQKSFDKADHDVTCERDGTCGTGVAGPGDATDDRKVVRAQKLKDLADARTGLASVITAATSRLQKQAAAAAAAAGGDLPALKQQLAALVAQRATAVEAFNQSNANSTGLLIQMQALNQITDRSPTLRNAHLLLLIFITAFECLPVIVKFLLSLGRQNLYERLVDIDEANRLSIRKQAADQDRATQLLNGQDTYYAAQVSRELKDEAIGEMARRRVEAQHRVEVLELQAWEAAQELRIRSGPPDALVPPPPVGTDYAPGGSSWQR